MSLKNKTFQIILRVLCGAFLVLALFLGVTAVVYSTGGGTPNIFGTNVYLLKTDAFDFLKNGTAVIAKQVPYSEIEQTNVVIFKLENGKPALAQVITPDLSDGVYSFRVRTENGAEITLTQSQVVAKGMSKSEFWGALISFAISPLGMLLIAIMPSIIIIVLEIGKYAAKIMPQPEVETVKKQYETPTYLPESEKSARERRGTAEAMKAYRGSTLDSSIGIYDTAISESIGSQRTSRRTNTLSDAARPSQRSDQPQQSPLFTSPTAPRRSSQQQRRPALNNSTIPLSQKKLNDAIEAAKAEHDISKNRADVVNDIKKTRGAAIAAEKEFEVREKSIMNQAQKTANLARTAVIGELSKNKTATMTQAAARAAGSQSKPAQPDQQEQQRSRQLSQTSQQRPLLRQPRSTGNTAPIRTPQAQTQSQPESPVPRRLTPRSEPEDNVRQYVPRRSDTNTATSIPRLDALLKEDADEPYNIDDILAGLNQRRN